MHKLLITGAVGLLGKEIGETIRKRLIDEKEQFPLWGWEEKVLFGRKDIDITKYKEVRKLFTEFPADVVLHLAAYTDVGRAESEKRECFDANVRGTRNIARFAKHLIYISTEYVFDGERGMYQENDIPNPQNFYSLTKLLGESEASRAPKFTIIRTLFKPRPFEHKYVATDMWTSGDYVDVIAKEIVIALGMVDRLPRVLHIGTGKKNLLDLAKQTREDIIPIKRNCLPIRLPRDTSLNTKLWEGLKKSYGK